MVKLLGVELGRPTFTEIGVGRARDRLALLRALHDHVALELCKRQQHVTQQRVDRVVGQDAEVQYVDGDALVDHLGDEAGRLRHRPREAVEPCHDQHIATPQLRPQPVPFRSVHLGAGERVRVDFFRARRRQRRLLRVQTVAVACLRFGGYSRVAEYHVNSPIFPVLTPRVLNIGFDTHIIAYATGFCNRWQYLKVLRQTGTNSCSCGGQQLEHDMIIQRTQEDKAVARATDPDFRESRPLKFDTEQLDYTMALLRTVPTHRSLSWLVSVSLHSFGQGTGERKNKGVAL